MQTNMAGQVQTEAAEMLRQLDAAGAEREIAAAPEETGAWWRLSMADVVFGVLIVWLFLAERVAGASGGR
jgi:hypothetical protein